MSGDAVLDAARQLVNGDRRDAYGTPPEAVRRFQCAEAEEPA